MGKKEKATAFSFRHGNTNFLLNLAPAHAAKAAMDIGLKL